MFLVLPLLWQGLTLALWLVLACQGERRSDPAGEAEPRAARPADGVTPDFDALMAALRSSELESQLRIMRAFAEGPRAPEAIPGLFDQMRREAPRLDNNVGLAVELILRNHPTARCPLEPLLEAIQRPNWSSQQKCAQALCLLLQRGEGAGREEELAALLIPLLASQRPRVFHAAHGCLKALTGEDHGDVPEGWLAWYRDRFAGDVDMTTAVYEDLIVIRPRAGDGAGDGASAGGGGYLVDGRELASIAELRAELVARIQVARERNLRLEASIQLPEERLARLGDVLEAPDLAPLVTLLLRELGITSLVFSPMSDAFRGPWSPRGSGADPR